MAVRFTVRLRSVIPSIPAALRSEAARITQGGLRAGEAVAKRESPIDTGFLRSSIGVRMTSQTSGVLQAKANYAAHVNYGTRNMAGRPFMDRGAAASEAYMRREWANIERRLPRV